MSTNKGSYENPYTYDEYELLLLNDEWEGGFVRFPDGIKYSTGTADVYGSSGNDGSGSDFGSDYYGCDYWGSDYWGSDYSGSDTTDIYDPWAPGGNTGNQGGNGGMAGGGNTGGGTPSGGGSGSSHSGGDDYPSGPSAQTLTNANTKLEIRKGANYLTNYTKDFMLNLKGYEGNIVITNTYRTPERQAQIMYDNAKNKGKEYQLNVYKHKPGAEVIQLYDDNKDEKEVVAAMAEKIRELGPYRVSHHCAASIDDFKKLNVFDISRTYSTNLDVLYSVLKGLEGKGSITYVLDEPGNNCIHVEIKQP